MSVIGPQFVAPRRIAASETRYEPGEPLYSDTTQASGLNVAGTEAPINTYTLVVVDTVATIGTNVFGGVAIKEAQPEVTGTLVAHKAQAACPIAWAGRLRAKATTAASFDTDAEILLVILDTPFINYNATGGVGSTELYTWFDAATADTSAFQVWDGDPAKSTLDCTIDGRGYRHDVV